MPKKVSDNSMEKLQSDLMSLSLNAKRDTVKPRCVGRCVIELGDISRHNVMVSVFFKYIFLCFA